MAKRVKGFGIQKGVRHGYIMSLWLFDLYMDGIIRDMKAKVGDVGVVMYVYDANWVLIAILFADDTVLTAED